MSDSYIKRHAEKTIDKLSEMFGAVLVAEPRQVGKTTMLQELTKDIGHVTLDDSIVRADTIERGSAFLWAIRRPYSWTGFKRRLFSLNRPRFCLTAAGRRNSSSCAAHSILI